MAKTSPAEFVRQVRRETDKVTWPNRKETAITTAMVLVMVILVALFFFLIDQVFAVGVKFILGIGS